MSHQYESTRGTAKEPTIEYSDSTRTTSAGSGAYGDPKVYGSNPNPHDNTSDFGRDTHVNQDSIVKDRADGKDRLGNDPNTTSTMTGSSKQGDLSGTTVSVDHNSGHNLSTHQNVDHQNVGHQNVGHQGTGHQDSGHKSGGLLAGLETAGAAGLASSNAQSARQPPVVNAVHPHGHQDHVHDNTCATDATVSDPNATGLGAHGGSAAGARAGKVPGAGTFDTEKNTHKTVFDGPEGTHHAHTRGEELAANQFDNKTTSSGAYGASDVGGSGMGTGIKSDYDKLGNRVGPGHREGQTFLDEDHSRGEKPGVVDKIKSKLGMNTGDERHGDFTATDKHGSSHVAGAGGENRI